MYGPCTFYVYACACDVYVYGVYLLVLYVNVSAAFLFALSLAGAVVENARCCFAAFGSDVLRRYLRIFFRVGSAPSFCAILCPFC